MEKLVIGVIDSELNNVTLLNKISSDFSFAKCYYYNLYLNEIYEEHSPKEIASRVQVAIDYLKSVGVNLFLFLGGEILDAADETIKSEDITYVSLVNAVSSYVNDNYNEKDVAFFAKSSIIKTNMFQREINYLHLYPVTSDEMEKSALLGEIKTDLSFAVCKKALAQLLHKSVDIGIFASINSSLFFTEINEFRSGINLIDTYIPLKEEMNKMLFDGDYKDSKSKKIILINDGKHLDLGLVSKCVEAKYSVKKVDKKNE